MDSKVDQVTMFRTPVVHPEPIGNGMVIILQPRRLAHTGDTVSIRLDKPLFSQCGKSSDSAATTVLHFCCSLALRVYAPAFCVQQARLIYGCYSLQYTKPDNTSTNSRLGDKLRTACFSDSRASRRSGERADSGVFFSLQY